MSLPFGSSELIVADTRQAVAYLAQFNGDRKRHLVAISHTSAVEAQSFDPDQDHELFAWLEKRQGVANLYQHVNALKAGGCKH